MILSLDLNMRKDFSAADVMFYWLNFKAFLPPKQYGKQINKYIVNSKTNIL